MSSSTDKPLRIRFVVHHHSNRSAGVSGATYALGEALERHGCQASYYHFDNAYGNRGGREVPQMIGFPWKVAADLAKSRDAFDIVDASTGDAWVWCARGRSGLTRAALVTRAHGLEHVASSDLRARAGRGEAVISWKYPVYHGGYRLWEVARSLRCSDAQIFLNEGDRQHATRELGVPEETTAVIPNGVSAGLLHDDSVIADGTGALKLAFIGSWIPLKGIALLVQMIEVLAHRNFSFTLLLLGTAVPADRVLAHFSPKARPFVTIVPKYEHQDLGKCLADREVLLQPSWTEGFSLALAEGMARGLAPVATDSGGASTIISQGESGMILASERADEFADVVTALAADRGALLRMRYAARASVQSLDWALIAERTLAVYRTALERRCAVAT